MKLAGHSVGPDQPLFLIAGPCVIEGATLTQEIAGRLVEITAQLGMPFIFKASFDKANRSSRSSYRGPGLEVGSGGAGIGAQDVQGPGAHRCPRGHARWRKWPPWSMCCRPRRSCAARPISSSGVAVAGQARQYQEGPVPVAVGDAQRRRQGAQHRQRRHHGVRARLLLRLQQSDHRHALAGHHARDRLPGGVRCHPLGAAARRAGQRFGRSARVRAGAGARRRRGRRRRCLHGDASAARQKRSRMAPMPGRSRACSRCWKRWSSWTVPSRQNPSRNHCYEPYRRNPRARNHRFARQPHGRGRCHPGIRRAGPRRGALGRLHRYARSGRAARRGCASAMAARAC